MPIVTSTIKGQIVIPAAIRARFKIKKGTQINVYDDGKILRALVEDRKKEAEL
jgi:AbrB family looped-hinge helix DNA binding protein